jgi:hypothetical protein
MGCGYRGSCRGLIKDLKLLPLSSQYIFSLLFVVNNGDYFVSNSLYHNNNTKKRNTIKADSQIACRAHAVPLPCRAAKGLECVFPIWFTQCGRVWFTLAMPRPCHPLTMPFFSRPRHSTAFHRRPVGHTKWSVLWATCSRSASPGYHAEFHEDCYQKHTNPHNDPYLRL